MIPANVEINKVEDFKGLKLRCQISPIAAETFIAVEAVPVQIELEEINEAMEDGGIVGGESTYARYYRLKQNEVCKVINDAEHSLFLTSIIVAKDFWSTLDEDLQKKVGDAAFDAARFERALSLSDVEIVKGRCATDGVKIVTLPAEEREKFKKKTAYLYDKFESNFSQGLLDDIRAVQSSTSTCYAVISTLHNRDFNQRDGAAFLMKTLARYPEYQSNDLSYGQDTSNNGHVCIGYEQQANCDGVVGYMRGHFGQGQFEQVADGTTRCPFPLNFCFFEASSKSACPRHAA